MREGVGGGGDRMINVVRQHAFTQHNLLALSRKLHNPHKWITNEDVLATCVIDDSGLRFLFFARG